MTDQERLEHLIAAHHPCILMVTSEEDYALRLVRDVALKLGQELRLWTVVHGVTDGLMSESTPVPETDKAAAGLYYLAHRVSRGLCAALDLADHLRDARTLRVLRELIRTCGQADKQLILIDHSGEHPSIVAREATRFEISLPDEREVEEIIRDALRRMHRESRIEVDITRAGLRTIVRNLRGLTRRQAEQIIVDVVSEDRRLNAEDINTVLARKRQALAGGGLLEYMEAPVDLSEIGGLTRLKRWLKQRQDAVSDEAAAFGIEAPRGVLMLGVQGAGKSLCAKAIATAWQRPLLRMDVGALYNQYIGESERRLRDTLRQAEMMAPIVLWVDEIEKAFASAASRSTDGGLSQRMFGALLTWMQEHREPVFLVATANDIEALPPELLRKGRFDEIFFVDLPGKLTRRKIFEIHLKKRKHDPARFELNRLAEASEGYSGAEIEQAVIAALHDAYADKAELDTDRLVKATLASPPLSVTMAERVAALRAWAKGRCVPAE